ncbi:predicted protein [Naegleria gruberi]|uniref:Predicted protein n=1 Tax=Naegleria gruberi TaxID=5762 RepID=D2UZW4_NAEGR|nr:uncharacterized protein NAEGRDRAFT_45568 [Naegleria gruberi]EFC50235.1 predicted protein [Naegleria gruberi]|eukprot:XP_002682979.1 predicted protein [Naegleria gruberi strain NEG-M]
MKPHQKHNTGPRQNLSSYFSSEQVDQQLFGEEDNSDAYEVMHMEQHNQMKKEKPSSKPSSTIANQVRGNILQHFYNPSEESDNEEQCPTQSNNNRHAKHQTQPASKGFHPSATYQKTALPPQSTTKQKKSTRQLQMEPQYPIYPNPYQFFPFYPPFYSPYSTGMTEESMKEQFNNTANNETSFMTDKSVESSIFFEKDKKIDMLLVESREMKQIIQSQSETIELILKKLEEVCNKVDSFNSKESIQHSEKQDQSNFHDIEQEPQPRQPPLNASNNFFTQNPSSRTSSSSASNMTSSLKNNLTSSTKFSNTSQVNESMTNNISSLQPKTGQNSSLLEKSANRSDTHSNRYSAMISPTISNSPIRLGSSQSSRLNSSQSSKKSVPTNSQHLSHSTISVNSEKSNFDHENPTKSPLYSSSSLKDFGSPAKSLKSDKQKRTSDESFLNASHLSESMDFLGDTHVDDSFVYNASYMSSYSSSHLEPFSTEMQKYVKEKILVGDVSKKDDIAKDSDNTFMTGSKKKKDNSLSYSSSSFPIKSFSKI